MFIECLHVYLIKTRLNLTSNLLHHNNPKTKCYFKNDLIYIRDFDVVQKTRIRVLSGLKTLRFASSF